MGLNGRKLIIASLFLMLVNCSVKKETVKNVNRFDCCDPGINAEYKDMCKWMDEKGTNRVWDKNGGMYEGVWSNCKPGQEPWRKYE